MRYLSAVLATVLVLTASGALALMMDVFSLEPIHGKSKRCSLVPQQPALSVLPIQQSYSAAIGSTQRSTFTVANTGNAAATGLVFDNFSSPAFAHASSATNPCGTTLVAKASCNADVIYTGTSGTQTGTLVIESDQYPPKGYAALSGKGLEAVAVCADGGAGYLVTQNVEGTGYDNGETWAETVGTNGVANEDDTTAPILRGNQQLKLYAGDLGQNTKTRKDFGTTYTTLYSHFMFRTNDATPSAASIIAQFLDTSQNGLISITLNSAGTLRVSHGTSGVNTVATLTDNTDYHIWFRYTAGTGTDGVFSMGFSTTGIEPSSGDYFVYGTNGTSTAPARFISLQARTQLTEYFDQILVSEVNIGDVCD